jgi:hypothetical protein
VTKRVAGQWFALKEVTNQLRRSNSVYGEYMAIADQQPVNMKETILTQERYAATKMFYFALRRCAFA